MKNEYKLQKNIEKFCYRYGKDDIEIFKEDIAEMLENIQFPFDPIIAWDFKPIFAFEAKGDYFFAHNYRHQRLFKKNAFLLQENVGNFTGEVFTCVESNEIWLLEDMSIVMTNCFRIEMQGNEGVYELNYRYITKETADFEIEHFISQLQEHIVETLYKH
ncbi:hypothetical protein [Anaerotignum sp.]|uniref:hypothetical protein n=1 Tax=Anaerotignum sp. TaxID=2039241 RepID=UPI0028A681AA|nr:hypothetical protein [Anaerotignum sp.]